MPGWSQGPTELQKSFVSDWIGSDPARSPLVFLHLFITLWALYGHQRLFKKPLDIIICWLWSYLAGYPVLVCLSFACLKASFSLLFSIWMMNIIHRTLGVKKLAYVLWQQGWIIIPHVCAGHLIGHNLQPMYPLLKWCVVPDLISKFYWTNLFFVVNSIAWKLDNGASLAFLVHFDNMLRLWGPVIDKLLPSLIGTSCNGCQSNWSPHPWKWFTS